VGASNIAFVEGGAAFLGKGLAAKEGGQRFHRLNFVYLPMTKKENHKREIHV
jgi:hypothetical protein